MTDDMNTYLEQLEAIDEDKRRAMCEALLDTMYAVTHQLAGLADNHPVFVKDSGKHNAGFDWGRLACLKWLEGAAIIELNDMDDFNYVAAGSDGRGNL